MSNELWRTALSTVRSRFESGAQQYHGVCCVLIHAGPGQRDRLWETPRVAPKGKLVDGSFAVYRQAGTPEQCTWRRHYYIGEPTGVHLFWSLAADAGRALLGKSSAAFQAFPRETLSASTDRHRWLWTLFDLAWQQRIGSPLKAAKLIWDREHMGITTFPHDTAQLRGLNKIFGGGSDILRRWSERLPDYFCSEVRNVFMASVYAIDIVLSDCGGRPRRRGSLTRGESRRGLKVRAERYVRAHGYPGLNALARVLGHSSSSSLSNAIKESTFLKARKAEHKAERCGRVRETPMTDAIMEGTEQQTEVDPRQAVLADLIDEQQSEMRADARRPRRPRCSS